MTFFTNKKSQNIFILDNIKINYLVKLIEIYFNTNIFTIIFI